MRRRRLLPPPFIRRRASHLGRLLGGQFRSIRMLTAGLRCPTVGGGVGFQGRVSRSRGGGRLGTNAGIVEETRRRRSPAGAENSVESCGVAMGTLSVCPSMVMGKIGPCQHLSNGAMKADRNRRGLAWPT